MPTSFSPPFSFSPSSTFPIDWSLVPSSPDPLSVPAHTDLGLCLCDLTLNSCDANCNCDADCSSLLSRFSGAAVEHPSAPTVAKCVDQDLVEINERGQVTTQLLSNALCVVKENNPSKGRFFSVLLPSSITSADFTTALSEKQGTWEGANSLTATAEPAGADAFYKVNDRVRGAYFSALDSSLHLFNRDGLAAFPGGGGGAGDGGGACADGYFPRYLNDSWSRCVRATENLPTDCALLFSSPFSSASSSLSSLRVAMKRAPSLSTATDFIPLLQGLSYFFDNSTGSLSLLASAPSTAFSASSCICANALKEARYTFLYDPSGLITSVSVDAVYTNVGPSSPSSCGGGAALEQIHVYSWNQTGAAAEKQWKGGNPGYLPGRPVVGGQLTSDPAGSGKQAISVERDGVVLLRHSLAAPGQCVSVTSLSSFYGDPSTVTLTFGEDLLATCYVPLTEAQLTARCVANSGPGAHFFDYFNVTATHLGVFGSASSLDVNEWVAIAADSTLAADVSATQPYVTTTQKCGGIVNSLSLQIMAKRMGALYNPQWAILGARWAHSTTDVYRKARDAPTVAEAVPVSVAVTWLMLEEGALDEYVPQAPPVLPDFPQDLLYPLYIPGAGAREGAMGAMVTGGMMGVAIMWLMMM